MIKSKKEEKSSENKTSNFEIILRILPLFPILGILYQIRALYGVHKMGGLLFFSWTQAINDTAGIFPFALPMILSIWWGMVIYHWITSIWNPKKWFTKYEYTFLLIQFIFLWILAWGLISSMLWTVFLFIFWYWDWGSFYSVIKTYAGYYILGSIIAIIYQKLHLNNGKFWHIVPWIVWGYVSMLGMYFLFPGYQQSTTTNLCIWREKDTLIPISYMNDRFAFYSGSIMSDSWSELMGSGIVVFSRLDDDRIIQCKLKDQIHRYESEK